MAEVLGPRGSAQLISKASKHVFISTEGVETLSKNLLERIKNNKEYIHFKGWKSHALNPSVCDQSAIDWIFLVDALNFSFWSVPGKDKYTVRYGKSDYTGYWSLCAAVNRALDQGIPITSAAYCKNFTIDQARQVFASDSATEMPMLEDRVKVMNEVGQILLEEFNGTFANCILKSNNNAQDLLKLVAEHFPCFRDEGEYEGQRVSFYKRAQILIADVWACFEGQGLGKFTDIDTLTMFADYRIPQTLVYFKMMSYSEELNALLNKDHMFQNGDIMEMDIRGVSIWAVELLVKRMNELIKEDNGLTGVHINAVLLDHFLWDYRRKHDAKTRCIPFHKVRCIYY